MRKSFSSSRFLQSSAAAHLALCRARNLRLPRRSPGLRGSRDQKIHCRFQACSLPTIEVARKQRPLESPLESSRIFEINWNFGRSFQIEAIEHRGTSGEVLDQRSNQAQEFLRRATTDLRWDCGKSLWSERPRIAPCSTLRNWNQPD